MRRYRFRESWHVPHAPEQVHAVLEAVEHYPAWWPQVLAALKLGEGEGVVVCRSVLPYDLELHLTELRRSPGMLESRLDGDLTGTVRWLISAAEGGTDLVFEQNVTARGPALALASYVGRPVLRWNHARMMAGCREGLARRLRAEAQ